MIVRFGEEDRVQPIDREKYPAFYAEALEKRKAAAYRVVFAYNADRNNDRLTDPDAKVNQALEDAVNEAFSKNDPEEFCWALILYMGLGHPDVPGEERENCATVDAMCEWADNAALTGAFAYSTEIHNPRAFA